MNTAILLHAEDWEGLFVNKKLVEEGHTLNEGYSRIQYFIELSEKYEFNLKDMKEFEVTEKDEDDLFYNGGFPNFLDNLSGKY